MTPEIDLIKSFGYRVFIRPGKTPPTYCYYTDGTHLGYAQWPRLGTYGVSTVHKACSKCGTGFHIADEITAATVEEAARTLAPMWARFDAKHVKKYANWDAFHNACDWNRELVEV